MTAFVPFFWVLKHFTSTFWLDLKIEIEKIPQKKTSKILYVTRRDEVQSIWHELWWLGQPKGDVCHLFNKLWHKRSPPHSQVFVISQDHKCYQRGVTLNPTAAHSRTPTLNRAVLKEGCRLPQTDDLVSIHSPKEMDWEGFSVGLLKRWHGMKQTMFQSLWAELLIVTSKSQIVMMCKGL